MRLNLFVSPSIILSVSSLSRFRIFVHCTYFWCGQSPEMFGYRCTFTLNIVVTVVVVQTDNIEQASNYCMSTNVMDIYAAMNAFKLPNPEVYGDGFADNGNRNNSNSNSNGAAQRQLSPNWEWWDPFMNHKGLLRLFNKHLLNRNFVKKMSAADVPHSSLKPINADPSFRTTKKLHSWPFNHFQRVGPSPLFGVHSVGFSFKKPPSTKLSEQ